jgi:hypothetical protein
MRPEATAEVMLEAMTLPSGRMRHPAPFMLANMEVTTAAERIQIARWSAIRDSCSQRVVALIEPHAGMSQGLWQNVARSLSTTGKGSMP